MNLDPSTHLCFLLPPHLDPCAFHVEPGLRFHSDFGSTRLQKTCACCCVEHACAWSGILLCMHACAWSGELSLHMHACAWSCLLLRMHACLCVKWEAVVAYACLCMEWFAVVAFACMCMIEVVEKPVEEETLGVSYLNLSHALQRYNSGSFSLFNMGSGFHCLI